MRLCAKTKEKVRQFDWIGCKTAHPTTSQRPVSVGYGRVDKSHILLF